MRVKYEVDKDKMAKFLDYLYTDKSPIDEYTLVVLGYIIDNNLLDYSFEVLKCLTRGYVDFKSPIMSEVEDLAKSYWQIPLKAPLTNKAIMWLKIGIDFMLISYKEYISTEVLKNKNAFKQENKVIKEYIIKNKDEFPDMYLELML